MTPDYHARGGATVAVLNRMEAWEASLVLNLRLWCEGPSGQSQVWKAYRAALSGEEAQSACHAFDVLMRTLIERSFRPLVRHDVGCSCVGADEGIIVNLVRTAAEGHLSDAALIATLMTGPAQAEHIAILAGQVGTKMREIHQTDTRQTADESTYATPGSNVIRLH
ncbi:MAG: hypothetical protein AB8B62_14935 [Roseobacter sp.]